MVSKISGAFSVKEISPRIGIMIIGAEKAGTSELASRMEVHSRVVGHTDEVLEYPGFRVSSDSSALESEPQLEVFSRRPVAGDVLLAKQVDMMYRGQSLRLLRKHNPECKVVCSLRHPIDRAYSSYWYQRFRGAELCATFEEAVERGLSETCGNERVLDTAHLFKSRYDLALTQVLSIFPKEQVKVVLFEDYVDDPLGVLAEVFEFVGMEPPVNVLPSESNSARMVRSRRVAFALFGDHLVKRWARRILSRRVRRRLYHGVRRANSVKARPPKISLQTREMLEGYFAASVIRTESLLGCDLRRRWTTEP